MNDSGTESCCRVQKAKRDETRRRRVGGIGRDHVTTGNSGGRGLLGSSIHNLTFSEALVLCQRSSLTAESTPKPFLADCFS